MISARAIAIQGVGAAALVLAAQGFVGLFVPPSTRREIVRLSSRIATAVALTSDV